jgi:hypothetical protein
MGHVIASKSIFITAAPVMKVRFSVLIPTIVDFKVLNAYVSSCTATKDSAEYRLTMHPPFLTRESMGHGGR